MSDTQIPPTVKYFLWGKAAGRCQYAGCNQVLYEDPLKKTSHNISYHAHIIGDSHAGPRGHATKSEELAKDIRNIMLLCDSCHRRVDRTEKDLHSAEFLQQMKRAHEERIEKVTAISQRTSSILFYGANIGQHSSMVTFDIALQALLKEEKYPAAAHPIEISTQNSSFNDREKIFWTTEIEQLNRKFTSDVKPLIISGKIQHLSVFALAPQPLLIELGRLLGDINDVNVHQLLREPKTWTWQDEPKEMQYQIHKPSKTSDSVALKLSLSATVSDDRIISVLGENTSIWTLTVESPNNNLLTSSVQLLRFRETMRGLYNDIKAQHGQSTELHLFLAAPVSAAVEIGRVWMPKADMTLHLYDQHPVTGGFTKVHTIKNEERS